MEDDSLTRNAEPPLWQKHFDNKDAMLVSFMKVAGCTDQSIADALGVCRKTLNKYFKAEMRAARDKLNARVAGKLFQNAMDGNVTAQIFWLKAQAGWKDSIDVKHSIGDIQPVIEIVSQQPLQVEEKSDE